MLILVCFAAAVVCWGLGFANFTYTTGNPAKSHAPNWIAGGLTLAPRAGRVRVFAGLGLWIAPYERTPSWAPYAAQQRPVDCAARMEGGRVRWQ